MKKSSQKNQILLPFTLEGNVANRDTVRSLSKNADGLRKISLSQIRIRPQFNARRQGDIPDDLWERIIMIPELADGIFANNGPADPPKGDFYTKDEYFYLTDGERRIRALRHLIATGREVYPNGNPVDEVLVILNPYGTTDLQRKVTIGTTQGHLTLKPMEWAHYYLSIKTEYKQSNQQIAELFNISRQKVDNYILATELPESTQQDIDDDKVKISNAIAEYRAKKKQADDPELTPSEEAHKRKKDKESAMSGDEDEFTEQDNHIDSPGTRGGPKEKSSGAITIPKDSIYKDQEDTAKWKQFLNRLEVLKTDCAKAADGDVEQAESKLIERLKMEYTVQVK